MDALHPGERLLERLQMGFSDPDPELFHRAHIFVEWADENPLGALQWRSKLRRTKDNPATTQLWAAVADPIEGREKTAPHPAEAPPTPRIITPSAFGKPVYTTPAKTQDTAFAQAECMAISQKYLVFKKSVVTDSLICEVSKFAPNRVKEALDLETRSDDTQDPVVRLAILRKAGSIWASLINIKEPVL